MNLSKKNSPRSSCSRCKLPKLPEEMSVSNPYWCKECCISWKANNTFEKTGRIPKRRYKWEGEWKICNECKSRKSRSEYSTRKQHGKLITHGVCKECMSRRGASEHLQKSYGMSLRDKEETILKGNGLCPICKTSDPGKCWAVDHCHRTGNVRGVICDKCNKMLGLAKDSIPTLFRAIWYLSKHYFDQTPAVGVEGVPVPEEELELEEA